MNNKTANSFLQAAGLWNAIDTPVPNNSEEIREALSECQQVGGEGARAAWTLWARGAGLSDATPLALPLPPSLARALLSPEC